VSSRATIIEVWQKRGKVITMKYRLMIILKKFSPILKSEQHEPSPSHHHHHHVRTPTEETSFDFDRFRAEILAAVE
jgi:hypothetical protein